MMMTFTRTVPHFRGGSVLGAAALLVLVVLLAVISGCGDGEEDPARTVRIVDRSFEPSVVTVGEGESVRWVNEDTVDHTVSGEDDIFYSGVLEPGDSFTFFFQERNEYSYSCTIHTYMEGTVIVEGGS